MEMGIPTKRGFEGLEGLDGKFAECYAMPEKYPDPELSSREAAIKDIREISKTFNLSRYLKVFLHEENKGRYALGAADAPSEEDDKIYREILIGRLREEKNSMFAGDSGNVHKFIMDCLNQYECYEFGRPRMIVFALVTEMSAARLNHILQVKLGERGVNYRDPDEAALLFALNKKAGFNAWVSLKERVGAEVRAVMGRPAEMLGILREGAGSRPIEGFVDERLSGALSEGEFAAMIAGQPLTCYARALGDALVRGKDTGRLQPGAAWELALKAAVEDYEGFIDRFPAGRGAGRRRYLEAQFPGFSFHGRSSRNMYTDVHETCKKIAQRIGREYKQFLGDELPEAQVNRANIYNRFLDIVFNDYKERDAAGSEDPLFKLPAWCKRALKTPLTQDHKNEIRTGNTAVLANDLVLLMLWKHDLLIQEAIFKHRREAGKRPGAEERRAIAAAATGDFLAEVDFVLNESGMGVLNPTNPFHCLAYVSFLIASKSGSLPVDLFKDMLLMLADDELPRIG